MSKDKAKKQNATKPAVSDKQKSKLPAKAGGNRIADNHRARFDYEIEKKVEAGMVLKGSEVKSCREGRVQLVDSFASFERNELFLLKAHIGEYKQGGPFYNHEPQRKRKLLMHRRELIVLKAAVEQEGYSIVPLRVYFNAKGKAKVELGLAKGKKSTDKRATLKERDEKRELGRVKRRTRTDE